MKFVLKHPRGNECFSGFSMILLVQSLFRHEVKRISGLTRLILPSLLDLRQRTLHPVSLRDFQTISEVEIENSEKKPRHGRGRTDPLIEMRGRI